jgi:hypothetical protein
MRQFGNDTPSRFESAGSIESLAALLRIAQPTGEADEFTPLALDRFIGANRADQRFRSSDPTQERCFAW